MSQPPPRLYPIDVPVLFGVANNGGEDASGSAGRSGKKREAQQRANTNGAARGQRTATRDEDLAAAAADVGDEEGAVREELDACMSALEDLKPKVRRRRRRRRFVTALAGGRKQSVILSRVAERRRILKRTPSTSPLIHSARVPPLTDRFFVGKGVDTPPPPSPRKRQQRLEPEKRWQDRNGFDKLNT